MPVKVLAVVPYPGLQDLIQDKIRNVPEIAIECIVADLKEAIPFVENAENHGYDVILSRGGTAELIRESVTLPVVDIPVSGYDILRVLTLVKGSNVPTAVVGFQNICNGALTVANLLNFKLPIYTVEAEEQVAQTLETALDNGASVVLGDVVTVKTAEALGYQGVLITSGPESVEQAIEEVQQVYNIYKKGQEESDFFETILDTVPQAVLVIGSDDKIKFANAASNRFIKGQTNHLNSDLLAVSPMLYEYIAGLKKNTLHRWQGHIQLNYVAASLTIQTMDWGGRSYFVLSMGEVPKGKEVPVSRPPLLMGSFSQISASSRAMQQVIKQAKAFAMEDKHIWISGEAGTEKNILAEAVHMASNRKNDAFYSVNCAIMSQQRIRDLLFGSNEQENQNGLLELTVKATLFLDQIEKLPFELQDKLWKRLKSADTTVRIIASSDLQMVPLLKTGFHKGLVEEIAKFHIDIPSLRTRSDDIEGIILLMISAHNAKYGKQIAGIRDEVLTQIKLYDWPGNTAELKMLIEEILILTDGLFVEMEQWQQVWKRFERTEVKHVLPFVSGTLKQMEKAMIEYVLHEEGMNQSKAAKRLGITRATLWRKLKE